MREVRCDFPKWTQQMDSQVGKASVALVDHTSTCYINILFIPQEMGVCKLEMQVVYFSSISDASLRIFSPGSWSWASIDRHQRVISVPAPLWPILKVPSSVVHCPLTVAEDVGWSIVTVGEVLCSPYVVCIYIYIHRYMMLYGVIQEIYFTKTSDSTVCMLPYRSVPLAVCLCKMLWWLYTSAFST